jgi:MFS family permease
MTFINPRAETLRRSLLVCGIVGAALYPLSDILASTLYPGFSYRDQAVSELFAIGAPTSALVVSLFSISSALLFLFAFGIGMSALGRRRVTLIAVMMALNTLDALVLWNFFPMHMRGVQPTFTDLMHGLLAIDPFLFVAVVLSAMAFPGRFRVYTVSTLAFTIGCALSAIWYVPAVVANDPTPWMGVFERAGQYTMNLWYAAFAVVLLRQQPGGR